MNRDIEDQNRYKVRLIDGILYDPWHPSGTPPLPETVAHGLTRLNRYGGHTTRPYSVCEHSLLVAAYVACNGSNNEAFKNAVKAIYEYSRPDLAMDLAFSVGNPHHALLGLIHDAPEGCGLVDLPGPVLRHVEMSEYKWAHVRCFNWLLRGWGLTGIDTPEAHEIVKAADVSILGAEMEIRPVSRNLDGGGEKLPAWDHLNLAKYSRNEETLKCTWIAAFNALNNKVRGA